MASVTSLKLIMHFLNFLFVLSGVANILVGSVIISRRYTVFLNDYIIIPIVLFISGVIIGFVAYLGCLGCIAENPGTIRIYALIVLVIFVIEVSVGIFAYAYKEQKEQIKQKLRDIMLKSLVEGEGHNKRAWDDIQTLLECCGTDGPKDYTENIIDIPKSCCKGGIDACNPSNAFQEGCHKKFLSQLYDMKGIIFAVLVGITFIELLASFSAYCLAFAIEYVSDSRWILAISNTKL